MENGKVCRNYGGRSRAYINQKSALGEKMWTNHSVLPEMSCTINKSKRERSALPEKTLYEGKW
jgi:hypothetical protein